MNELFGVWQNITVCPECHNADTYRAQHPANPCLNCGYKKVKESVGRWVETSPWWKFWESKGWWELRESVPKSEHITRGKRWKRAV